MPTVGGLGHFPTLLRPTIYDIRRSQFGQKFKPQTGRLYLTMPELPRLNDLIGLAPPRRKFTDRIFHCDTWNIRFHQIAHEFQGHALLAYFVLPPTCTRRSYVSARW